VAYPQGLDEFRADTGVTHAFNHPNISQTGQCVWFVRAVRPDMATLPSTLPDGYAYRMWQNGLDSGWHGGQTPKPGALMVIGTARVPTTGHVAIVQAINGDGTIDVWDSNWGLDLKVRKRRLTNPTSGLLGYLYGLGSDNPPILGSSLVVAPDGVTAYLLQNARLYHVASYDVVLAMESAGMPGWVWASRRQLGATEFAQYRQGPEFILPSSQSNGLLVREKDTTTVYLLQNGRKRAFQSPAALNWMGRDWFGDVIDVAPGMLSSSSYVLGTGNPIYELGASLTAAYSTNATDASCTAPPEWVGWPVDPSYPSTFSKCLEFPIEGVGTSPPSAVSGIGGSYQNMGAESGLAKGAIEQTSLGTYAVHGAIFSRWRSLGYASSALGFPTGNEYSWNGNRRSNFEGGYIYWTPPPADTTTVVLNPATCTSFSISPTSASPSSSSGSTAVTVTGSPAGCAGGGWSASGNGSWISVSPTSGSGSGSVSVSWTQNTGSARSGYATVAGHSFAVDQVGGATSARITISSPNDGATLLAGSTYTVRWTSANLSPGGNVQLHYLDTSGWTFITSLSPSVTQYAWTVPTTDAPVSKVFVGSAVGSTWEASDDASVLITRPTSLYTVSPCRVIDTRLSYQGGPAVSAGDTRAFKLTEACGVPATAQAVAVNVTVTGPSANGNIRFFPSSLPETVVSVLNYVAGQTRANNAVLPLGTNGSVDLKCSQATGTVDVVIDVVGYFE
jgi:surface antigen